MAPFGTEETIDWAPLEWALTGVKQLCRWRASNGARTAIDRERTDGDAVPDAALIGRGQRSIKRQRHRLLRAFPFPMIDGGTDD
jgi:hypothetical protein